MYKIKSFPILYKMARRYDYEIKKVSPKFEIDLLFDPLATPTKFDQNREAVSLS